MKILPELDAIFYQDHEWPLIQEDMRKTFLREYRQLLLQCEFPSKDLRPLLRPGVGPRAHLPFDLDPTKITGRLFLVDYMNIFPDFRHNLLQQQQFSSVSQIFKRTQFKKKVERLDHDSYLVALIHYLFQVCHQKQPPTSDDWVILITQGDTPCGKASLRRLAFLQDCHVLVLRVPCFSSPTVGCFSTFQKNEVDDYVLLYFAAFFDSYYKECVRENRCQMKPKLFLVSKDKYRWSHPSIFKSFRRFPKETSSSTMN